MIEFFRPYLKTYLKIYLAHFDPYASPQPGKAVIRLASTFALGPALIILVSVFIPHSLGWQILIAIITAFLGALQIFGEFIMIAVTGEIMGAKYILHKLPIKGEKQIEVTDGNEVIWGEKIKFQPDMSEELGTTFNLDIGNNLDLPKDPYYLERWNFWATLILPLYKYYSSKKILNKFKKDEDYKHFREDGLLPKSRTTITKIIKAIRANKLPLP